MTENSTSTHETNALTDDNFSWDFEDGASNSTSFDHSKGWSFVLSIVCFFGIILIGVIYLWCRLLREENDEEDDKIELEPADDEINKRNISDQRRKSIFGEKYYIRHFLIFTRY